MKHIYLIIIISASEWPLVHSTEPDLDAIFVTEHNAMNLQDNEWTNMIDTSWI